VALASAACLLVSGCSVLGAADDAADKADTSGGGMKVALVTHGGKGDAFWDLVRRGAETAAAKDGIDLTYAGDSDPACAAGIPVVGLNSGIDAWRPTGLLEYFGQNESVAGRAVGDKLDEVKAKHALCVVHERGNVALEARCAGVRKTFRGDTDNLYVDGADMNAVTATIASRLRQDSSIDEVVTLGAQYGLSAVKAVEQAGSRAEVATFDLNKDLVKAVQDGDVQFAVDQQPYLQGYLAVDALWLYRTNGNISGGGTAPVLTGPAFVTRSNVSAVARFAAAGTR
jgi:simple sugar transport system substrate-binding protein